MALNPDLAWAHFVTGTVHHRQGRIQEFLDCLKQALAIERASHVLSVLGIYLPEMGKVAAAEILDDLRAAWKRFAYNEPWSTYELGYAALHAGKEDEALERFRYIATSDNPCTPASAGSLLLHSKEIVAGP